jgi:PAS domain S-box-containing protein
MAIGLTSLFGKPSNSLMPPLFWQRLLRNFLPVALILVTLGGGVYVHEAKDAADELTAIEQEHLHAAKLTVYRHLLELSRDTLFLANSPALTQLIARPDVASRNLAEREYAAFIDAKPDYRKVRWIDQNGMERVRVELKDSKVVIHPSAQNELKTLRYYFVETMKLKRGELFLSPLDLDIEHDIATLNPTLRAATPLFDQGGRARGIVVVSYSVEELFERIQSVSISRRDNWMLLDRHGYWLRSPIAADEFGFILPHHANMASRQPQVWQRINAAPSGHFIDEHGDLWLFETLHPYQGISLAHLPHDSAFEATALTWKLVKHIDSATLRAANKSRRILSAVLFALMLVLALLISVRLTRTQLSREAYETELERTLAELNQEKYAIDQHAIVTVTDVLSTIAYVNDRCCAISQYSRDELMGQNHRLLNSGHHDSEFFRTLYQHINAGETWHGEICNRAKDGSLYWVNTTIVPFMDHAGQATQYISISDDITELKQREMRLTEAQHLV